MKIYKNLLCTIAALAVGAALVGCSQNTNTAEAATDTDPATGTASDSTENSTSEEPTLVYSDYIDENGFWKGVKALDSVEKFEYKKLSIPSDVHKITDENLQAEIDSKLTSYATSEQVTDRAVLDGDTVNIDYVGSVDGVEFEGGTTSGEGTDVTIGVTSYIDDFLEQLIGHTPGETINVEVTFPDDYQSTDLQGKDALFVTTINYIVNQVTPELTDDFVKTNFSESDQWETVEEMRDGMRDDLQKQAIQQHIVEYLVNEVTVKSIPDRLTEYQEKAMIQYYKEYAGYYSMEFDEFLNTYMSMTLEELIETNSEVNAQNATYGLVLQAVAEDAGISVTEDDMIAYFTDYSQYEEQYGLPYLKQIVLYQNAVDYIMDNAVLE